MKRWSAFLTAAAVLAAVPVPVRASDYDPAPGAAAVPGAQASAPLVGHRVTRKAHRASCEWAGKISAENRVGFKSWKEAQAAGYVACGKCKPDVEEVSGSAVALDMPLVGNRYRKTLHRAGCEFVKKISPLNRAGFKSWKEAEAAGFTACGVCRPDAARAGAEASVPAKTPAAGELCASRTGKTFHKPDCAWAKNISGKNLVVYKTRDDAIASGKTPCTVCNP